MTAETLPSLDYLQVQDPEEAHRALAAARRHAPKPKASPRGERHHRQRRLVAKAFTPRAIARLQQLIVEIITELLDAHVPAGRCDVVCDIAEPLPTPVICALLGTPRRDWKLFSDWSTDIKKIFDWNLAADEASILSAWRALDEYGEDMVARRRHMLTDDLISELIRAEDDGQKLDHDELLALAVALLGAGTELVPRAVEEVMRYRLIGFSLPRIATEDVELAGIRIPAGTLVFANIAAANRDPAVFTDPDRFDGPARTHRSADRDGQAHAQPAPHRTISVAVDARRHRTRDHARRIRSVLVRENCEQIAFSS